jgi:hypothetical protein
MLPAVARAQEGGNRMSDRVAAQRPFLSVMSTSVDDAVRFAGGLIFDRVKFGWRVIVLLPAGEDTRPLRILGADIADVAAPPTELREHRTALAASATMCAHDASTRSEVATALATKTTEVIVWGAAIPDDLERGSRMISYRLSSAALAFKCHAMTAASLDPLSIEPTEIFRTTCAPHVMAPDLNGAG